MMFIHDFKYAELKTYLYAQVINRLNGIAQAKATHLHIPQFEVAQDKKICGGEVNAAPC